MAASSYSGIFYQGSGVYSGARAIVARRGNQIAISFRGTDSGVDFINYGNLFAGNTYINAFASLLTRVSAYASSNGLSGSDVLVTGHSLGAGAANNLRNVSASSFGGFFDTSTYVTFATPFVSASNNILNFGFENDAIFQVSDGDTPNRTDNVTYFDAGFAGASWPGLNFSILDAGDRTSHGIDNYICAVDVLASSPFFSETNPDSVVIIDRVAGTVQDKNTASTFGDVVTNHVGQGALIIGEERADTIRDGTGNDWIDARGGADIVVLSDGSDRVYGGLDSDTVILFNDSRADATVSVVGSTRTISLAGGEVKTLVDVEKVIYRGLTHVTSSSLLPHGSNVLFANDDGSSSLISLGSIFEEGLDFNGRHFTGVYVNNNGSITFEGPLSTFTPQRIGDGSQTIIAPFWGDVDTRPGGSSGSVSWDFNTARDSFIVTWDNVGYYNQHTDKRNTFQLELVDQGAGNFEIIYRYTAVNWTTGDASGGSGGLGGVVARAGFSSGNGLYFELPGSGSQASVLNWENTRGTTGIAGVWQFQVYDSDLLNMGSGGSNVYNGTSGDDYYFGNGGADILAGGRGNDRLFGGTGGDRLNGGDGNDLLDGGAQNDTFIAGSGAGDDIYIGGDGIDTVIYKSTMLGVLVDLAAVVDQATGPEIGVDQISEIENVTGGSGADQLRGDGLSNVLVGLAGGDLLDGRGGNDNLLGGLGDDTYFVDASGDKVTELAGQGTDTVHSLISYILGPNVENLVLLGGGGAIHGTGNELNNVISGNASDNKLKGGLGLDTVSYEMATAGVVVGLAMTSAQNTVGAGTDTLSGFENLRGSTHGDNLTGSGGNNVLEGLDGDDTLNGGAGTDTASYLLAGGAVTVSLAITTAQNTGGAGTDTLTAIERLIGSTFADVLTGDSLANRIDGLGGDDTIEGGAGADTLIGGTNGAAGDTVSYASASAGVTVKLGTQDGLTAQNTVGGGSDVLSGFENVTGSGHDDKLVGSSLANVLSGGAGNDTLDGKAGTDILIGGTGADVFHFHSALNASTNVDHISDFELGTDRIELENAIFTKLTALGTLSVDFFVIGTLAADANDYVIYDDVGGALYYDSNGSGAGGQVQFATLATGLALTNASFAVT